MKTLKEFYDDLLANFPDLEDEHAPIGGADMVDYICNVVKDFEI